MCANIKVVSKISLGHGFKKDTWKIKGTFKSNGKSNLYAIVSTFQKILNES